MTKPQATATILLGATFMSFVGLTMRMIDQADGFQILIYRSAALAGMIALMACLKRKVSPLSFLRSLDRNDMVMGFALSVAFTTYVFAMLNTSVASTLFILSISPLFAALMAWAWLGERPTKITLVAMGLAIIGVGLMVQSGATQGRSLGNIFAFISAACFALMLTLARRSRKTDVLGGTFMGGIFCVVIGITCALLLGNGLSVSQYDLWLSLFMGGFTIGIGIGFVTWGTPYVPAAEVGLLVLLESVLGPIWVWLFVNEAMSSSEIIGGIIVLTAIAGQAAFGRRPSRVKAI
ncbi:EamA-like transporter family protein [Roseovarius albus]|uniref:EamA-like transporter family protein n=1 Tax=Roseovarius albus TaxID=1247867 RepID=A0A1X6YJD7_9RHOB|nr:DMT family transporter [Roseovarius albus]SLN22230.1 EamA-like transporter family protein [Roseovarius albus]